METKHYRIPGRWRWGFRCLGLSFVIAALAYPVGHLYAPDEIGLILTGFVTLFFGACGLLSLWSGLGSGRYDIESSDQGVRGRDAHLPIPWGGPCRFASAACCSASL